MLRAAAVARFPSERTIRPPPPPLHTGQPLRVGETVLLRRPGSWVDLFVELRAIDDGVALIRLGDHLERVELIWLRRAAK
jgi:hypothetical protein